MIEFAKGRNWCPRVLRLLGCRESDGCSIRSNIRIGINAWGATRVPCDCALYRGHHSPLPHVFRQGNGTVTQSSTHSALPSVMVRPAATGGFALGLGLTNECNLSCSFCYRDPARTDRLKFEQVRSVMESLPIRSVNLGTGENGMHPQFRDILAYLRTLPVKLTITSNGHSAAVLLDDELRAFHDIEFSLDYPTEREQDTQRGNGNWALIHDQAARCVRLGIPVTFVAVMMKSNCLRLAEVARAVKRYESPLRVNVYQAVRSDLYALSYDEYWKGFRALFAETDVIAIGEPLVRAMAGLPPRAGGCGGRTVRVVHRATTHPPVYWPGAR